MTIEEINKAIQALDIVEPLIDYVEDPKSEREDRHNQALAAMYVSEDFRSYLISNLNAAIKATALRSVSEVDTAFGKARILTLKEILVKSRRAFIGFEKIRKMKEQLDEKRRQSSQSNAGVQTGQAAQRQQDGTEGQKP